MSKMIEINLNPDAGTLRQFGFIALVGFGFVAAIAWFEVLVFSFGLGAARPWRGGSLRRAGRCRGALVAGRPAGEPAHLCRPDGAHLPDRLRALLRHHGDRSSSG